MIFDALLGVLFGAVEAIIGLFPADTLDGLTHGDVVAEQLGVLVGPLDSLAPVSETAATLSPTLNYVIPPLLTARVSLWLYFMTPVIK